jgi:hypothetical protein
MASEAKNQRANSPFKDELRLGGFGLKRLIDLPIAWPAQWRELGLQALACSWAQYWFGARRSVQPHRVSDDVRRELVANK